MDGLRAPILATRISPRAGSAPLARWQGGSRERGDRVWFSETGHFERRPIPVRTTINPRHQLPHDQSRCITCTLYCHVGQAWYSPQTTDFMCHDEDVAKLSWPRYEASLERPIAVFDRGWCGPAGCSGEGCHKFHVFNGHQKHLTTSSATSALGHPPPSCKRADNRSPNFRCEWPAQISCVHPHSLVNPIPNSNSIQSNPNSIPHSLGYGVPCVGSAKASGLQACRC